MNGLYTVAATVCACCIIVTLLSHFVSDGGTKKLVSLVMGAFILCATAVPAANAVGSIASQWQQVKPVEDTATADEAVNREVLNETKHNLETALKDIMAQNGYAIRDDAVTLAIAGENRVVIAQITVTVGEQDADHCEAIAVLTEKHFAVRPQVEVE